MILGEFLLNRFDALEPSLNAWVTIDCRKVPGESKKRQESMARKKSLGPLYGIPSGVKDIYYTAGPQNDRGAKKSRPILSPNVMPLQWRA
jgi:Asp-tRNA(Asn)/Glu-tRNA(Gln) amidotransferase A subunit family amidase